MNKIEEKEQSSTVKDDVSDCLLVFESYFSEEDKAPADSSSTMSWKSASIQVGQKLYCRGWSFYHPGNFFVVDGRIWKTLDRHQRRFNKFYENPLPNSPESTPRLQDDPRYKPDPKKLTHGQYIAVLHKASKIIEWHRGLILHCYNDALPSNNRKPTYKVMLVDYGEHGNYTIDKIRLIPKKLLNYPAQAIKCALYFDGPGKILHAQHHQFEWTFAEANLFANIMDPVKCEIEFVEYEMNQFLANPMIWKCRVWKFVKGEIMEKTVKEMFFTQLQEKYVKQEKMKNEKGKDLHPLPVDPWEEIFATCSVTDLEESTAFNESLTDFKGIFIYPKEIDEPDDAKEEEEKCVYGPKEVMMSFLRVMKTQEQEENP